MFSKISGSVQAVQAPQETKPDGTAFLDDARQVVNELVALRARLVEAQSERGRLVQQRDALLATGIDKLPDIKQLHVEIEGLLPVRISNAEARVRAIIQEGVASLNDGNTRKAAERSRQVRTDLRSALEDVRDAWIKAHDAAAEYRAAPEPLNSRITAIEETLGGGRLPRLSGHDFCIPIQFNSALANQPIAALDDIIRQISH